MTPSDAGIARPQRQRVLGRQPPERSGALTGTMNRIHKENTAPVEKVYLDPNKTSKTPGRINLKAVADVLMEQGLDPTVELINVLRSGRLDADVQARVLGTLMEYVHSKKKSVEVTGADGGPIQVEHLTDAMLTKIALQAVPDVIDVDAKDVSALELLQ